MDLLHGRVDGDSYWTVGEWGYSEALRIMGDNGYYGGVFDTLFRKSCDEDVE